MRFIELLENKDAVIAEIERKLKQTEGLIEQLMEIQSRAGNQQYKDRIEELREKYDNYLEQLDALYAETSSTEDIVKEFATMVKKRCQPFLQAIDGNVIKYPMYRGLDGEAAPIVTKKMHLTNRYPKNTDQEVHDKINWFFKRKFGHPYRNGLFCTGDVGFATDYGTLYIVFPIGKFEYLWSLEVNDLFSAVDEIEHAMYDEDKEMSFMEVMNTYNYQNRRLKDAIETGHEIMIWGRSYLGMRIPTREHSDILALLQQELS